jgi:ferredoxin
MNNRRPFHGRPNYNNSRVDNRPIIAPIGQNSSVSTSSTPRIKSIDADSAMDSAACIGCGACVAACKNASAMLFVSAKVSQLALLPQGQPERYSRVQAMVAQMDAEGFGSCTNTGACEAECPKEISVTNIARTAISNRETLIIMAIFLLKLSFFGSSCFIFFIVLNCFGWSAGIIGNNWSA